MDENKIIPGYKVEVSEDENIYTDIENAVNEHNESAEPGEKYWGILIDNGYYSVYEYGEVPELTPESEPITPPEPTIEEIQREKSELMSNICEQSIYNGIDVELTTGTKHFSLQVSDQTNINGIFNAVILGATEYPYHADEEPCTMFKAEDIVTLYVAYKSFVTQQTTYYNALRQWIEREEDKEVLSAIQYGDSLPDDLQANVEEILNAANEQVQDIVIKLTGEK